MKEIKDCLHLYLGQKIQLHESRFSEPETDRLFTLSGIEENTFCVGETRLWYRIEVYRGIPIDLLILRPLSDMTEEEKMEVRKICSKSQNENLLPEIRTSHILQCWHPKNSPEMILYLLSRGFDLFGLIEENLAIDKTKIK